MKDKKVLLHVIFYFALTIPFCYIAYLSDLALVGSIIIFSFLMLLFVFMLVCMRKKKLEEFFTCERDMLYNILEDVNAMIIVWDSNMNIVNVNDCFTEKTGYDKEDVKSSKLLLKILGLDSNKLDYSEICTERETHITCLNESKIDVFWKTTLLKKESCRNIFMSIGSDTTKIKNIQNELCASETRFETSMELAEVGLLYKQVGSNEYFMSKNIQKILGFESQNVSTLEFRERIHPNDKPVFDTYCVSSEECVNEEIHKVKCIELRIFCKDEGYHWFNYRYKISNSFGAGKMVIGGSLINISKDKEKDTLIEKMAYIDEVTQIFNRNRFMMMGQETYLCSKELNLSYWLIIFDVDKFHIINDTCGYQNGNCLLKEIAITILRNLSDGGFCARIGGDNFAVLLKDDGNDDAPLVLIDEIQKSLYCLSKGQFANQTITASVGYCKLPCDGDDFSEILEHAEFALRLGENLRSNITRYDNSVHDKTIAKSAIEKELQNAIYNHELKLYYQPKIDLTNNKIMGAEALIRWIKPDGTIIPPNDFIPIAENSNLITQISEFVVNEACRQNMIWQNMGLPCINVSVNLSSVDFYQTDVCKTISTAISASGLSPEWLEVELTESLALKDVDQAILQMNGLKEIGVKISMDDFGTGYSSLSYIQVLPITMLKLDRSFIMYLEDDNISREIVSSVINICKSKRIEIIAEGIETLGQANILKSAGCDLAQGYLFGKPMPSEEFEQFMRKAN